jgi:hypothetical protein
LTLLALAARHGRQIEGQTEAISRLCAWFDTWQQPSPHGPWWPQWITRDQQLAAIATNDCVRRAAAEETLAACLSGPALDRLTDAGICHGLAGLHQTASRAAADAENPPIAQRLPALADLLASRPPGDDGFLTGHPGVALGAGDRAHLVP